jgi:phosphoadenosine phosphosulfate reductase
MLIEHTLFGTVDKVQVAIDRLKEFEPPEGYYVAFSGGKDSCVVKDIVKRSGVKHEFHFNRSMEPPEVIYYIREHHPDVIWHLPKKTMWESIAHKGMPPTRIIRFCCDDMKENQESAKGRFVVTGVRWEESNARKGRQFVEQCYTDTSKKFLHPIIDWSTEEIWEYIKTNGLPYCKLYDEGRTRVGCVMCPMANSTQMKLDAIRWPKIADAYKRACDRAIIKKREIFERKGKTLTWKSGQDMYDWWISGQAGDTSDDLQQRFFFE